jgi:hypothetical protein
MKRNGKLLLITFIASLVYFGPAILGRAGFAAVFPHRP